MLKIAKVILSQHHSNRSFSQFNVSLFCTGDISRDDYQFGYNVVTINSTSRSLHLYWTITNATWGLLDSHFIRGFNYTVQQLDNGEYYTTTVTTNLTVIVTLNSSNWYMMIGRILTNDKDSWGPEPVYLYLPPSYTPLSGEVLYGQCTVATLRCGYFPHLDTTCMY